MDSQDFTVWRGNSYRVVGWNFPFDLADSEIVLKVAWRGGSLVRSTLDGGLLKEQTTINGESMQIVWWKPTTEESRMIPPTGSDGSPKAEYEVERHLPDGEQRTYVRGRIFGEGGINID